MLRAQHQRLDTMPDARCQVLCLWAIINNLVPHREKEQWRPACLPGQPGSNRQPCREGCKWIQMQSHDAFLAVFLRKTLRWAPALGPLGSCNALIQSWLQQWPAFVRAKELVVPAGANDDGSVAYRHQARDTTRASTEESSTQVLT